MVSGLFSAKTVVHLSTAPATASFEHAVAVCTDTPALNTSTTALIARRVCIISSLISSGTSPNELASLSSGRHRRGTRCAGRNRPRGRRAADQRDELAASHSITSSGHMQITVTLPVLAERIDDVRLVRLRAQHVAIADQTQHVVSNLS